MTPDEIRSIKTHASDAFTIVYFLREIAAQLAELNQNLKRSMDVAQQPAAKALELQQSIADKFDNDLKT